MVCDTIPMLNNNRIKVSIMDTITIDLTPYNVEVSDNGITVLYCSGSILAKLDTDVKVTKNRFSDEHTIAEQDGVYFNVYYDNETGTCDFTPTSENDTLTLDMIVSWIDRKYDCIESIEWETLETID